MNRPFFRILALLLLLSSLPIPASAFTMIDKYEDEIFSDTFKPGASGLPAGDILRLTRFRTEKGKYSRITFTYRVAAFLSDRDTELKHHLKVGDLIVIQHSMMNPNWVNMDTPEVVGFVRDVDGHGGYAFMGLKAATVKHDLDPKSGKSVERLEHTFLQRESAASAPTAAVSRTTSKPGHSTREDLQAFVDRNRHR